MLVPDFRRASFENLRYLLAQMQLSETEEAWSHFKDQLLTQQGKFVSYCERRHNIRINQPWFNNEIKQSLQNRNII